MDPWLEDHAEGVEGVLTIARKRTADANKFKRTLHQYPDLVHASSFPETDEDIIASIILRYLHDNIFQAILYSDIPKYTEVVSFIENSMQMSVEPKRGMFPRALSLAIDKEPQELIPHRSLFRQNLDS